MNRHGATKEEIIKLISHGDNTLSAICKKLGLAPSTVSKHLQDLEDHGIIRQRDVPFKKWKYYDLNQEINAEKVRKSGVTVNRMIVVSAIAVLGLMASLYALGAYYSRPAQQSSYVPISITDPPIVPQGTRALYINYSSLKVHVSYSNASSAWLDLHSRGRLNLMSLINESQIIGLADVRQNAAVDGIKFNITYASITIGNSSYSVYVPIREVVANVTNGGIINDSSDVLMDFYPSIATLSTQNTTVFILVPALRAAVFSNPGMITRVNSGVGIRLTTPIGGMFSARFFEKPDINATVSNATLAFDSGSVSFDASISNHGSSNLTVISMSIVNGTNDSQFRQPIAVPLGASAQAQPVQVAAATYINQRISESGGEASSRPSPNGSDFYVMRYGGNAAYDGNFFVQSNSSVIINASAVYSDIQCCGINSVNITLKSPVNSIRISGITGPTIRAQGFFTTMDGGMDFMVNYNGTLSSPYGAMPLPAPQEPLGYSIGPHSAARFAYNGQLGLNLPTNPSGSYRLLVFTDKGVLEGNVTVD